MQNEFNEYFNRQIKLWGEEVQNSLQNKKIAIIGSGGLGCTLGIALGASGIGEFAFIDFDTVGVHNIHRQIGFKVGDDGKYKADVLKELIEVIYVLEDGSLEIKFKYQDEYDGLIKYLESEGVKINEKMDNRLVSKAFI